MSHWEKTTATRVVVVLQRPPYLNTYQGSLVMRTGTSLNYSRQAFQFRAPPKGSTAQGPKRLLCPFPYVTASVRGKVTSALPRRIGMDGHVPKSIIEKQNRSSGRPLAIHHGLRARVRSPIYIPSSTPMGKAVWTAAWVKRFLGLFIYLFIGERTAQAH